MVQITAGLKKKLNLSLYDSSNNKILDILKGIGINLIYCGNLYHISYDFMLMLHNVNYGFSCFKLIT